MDHYNYILFFNDYRYIGTSIHPEKRAKKHMRGIWAKETGDTKGETKILVFGPYAKSIALFKEEMLIRQFKNIDGVMVVNKYSRSITSKGKYLCYSGIEKQIETCRDCASVADWIRLNRPAYEMAKREGTLAQIKKKMNWRTIKEKNTWTFERQKQEASRFKTLRAWRAKSKESYKAASDAGNVKIICRLFNLKRPPSYMGIENIKKHLFFTSMLDLRLKNKALYNSISKQRLLDEVRAIIENSMHNQNS